MKQTIKIWIIALLCMIAIPMTAAELLNTSIDASDVSLHLRNSDNHNITDAQYGSTLDITAGLSDDSDLTAFNTMNALNSSLHLRFEEGSGSTAIDESGNGNDVTLTNPNYVSSMGGQGTGSYQLECNGDDTYGQIAYQSGLMPESITVMGWVNMADSDTVEHLISNANTGVGERSGFVVLRHSTGNRLRFQGGDGIVWPKVNLISTTVVDSTKGDTHFIATVNSTESALWIDGVEENTGLGFSLVDSTLDTFLCRFDGSNPVTFNGTFDNLIIIPYAISDSDKIRAYNDGLPRSDLNAIKVNFTIDLDSANDYFLRVRKTTTGTDNISIYAYLNGSSSINLTAVDSALISQGWNDIPIVNTFIDGVQALFRFYTEIYSEFSEVILLEQLNNTLPPSIVNCQVNNTALTCDDVMKFSCNVTDTLGIDTVFFSWEDSDGKNFSEASIESGDIYTIEKQYSEVTSGAIRTYNFTNATATDPGNNVNSTSFLIPYNYSCAAPDFNPPVITTFVANNSLIDLRITNQTINFTVTDNIGIKNVSYYVFNESGIVFQNDEFFNSSETDVDILKEVDISNFGSGFYFVNRIAYDTSNNSAVLLHRFTIVNFDTVITLIAPFNNSIDIDGFVEFAYNISIDRQTSLYIDGILNQTMEGTAGLNTFPSPVIFRENRSANWFVRINAEEIDSVIFNLNLTIFQQFEAAEPREDEYILGVCPVDTLPRAILFIFFVIMAFAIVFIGFAMKNGLVASIGSMMMIGTGVYLWFCLGFVSLLMMLLGVIFLVTSVFKGAKAFK